MKRLIIVSSAFVIVLITILVLFHTRFIINGNRYINRYTKEVFSVDYHTGKLSSMTEQKERQEYLKYLRKANVKPEYPLKLSDILNQLRKNNPAYMDLENGMFFEAFDRLHPNWRKFVINDLKE